MENSTQAVEYVDKGNQLLVSAKRIQRNTRKWACCALMILMAIIFVIVMAVLKPWETGVLDGTEWDPEHMESKRPPIMDRIAEKAAAWSAANAGN